MNRRAFLGSASSLALLGGCSARGAFIPPSNVASYETRPVLIATNRANLDSLERTTEIGYTYSKIAVPRGRAPGALPVTGENAFALLRDRPIRSEADLKRSLGPAGPHPLVLWVHGFNTTPAEAVYRQAQLSSDVGLQGPQMSFVWPSAGTATGYLHDRDSALQSRGALEDVFRTLGRVWGGPILLVAHSLGCLLSMEALVRMRLQGAPPVLDGIVLLQPDIDPEVFRSQVADISPLPDRSLLVVSGADPVLRLSALVAQDPNRVGAAEDVQSYEQLGFRVLDLTGVEDASNPHLVALTSPTVLNAMRRQANG